MNFEKKCTTSHRLPPYRLRAPATQHLNCRGTGLPFCHNLFKSGHWGNQKAKQKSSLARGPCFPQHRMLPVVLTAQVETVPASTWLQVLPAGTLVKRPNEGKST